MYIDELRQTIDRIKRMTSNDSSNTEGELKRLLRQMQADGYRYRERFLVAYKDGFEVVNVDDIAFVCTEYKDTRIYLADAKKGFYSISMSLDEIEHQLNPQRFFRVNRQFIVNISAVAGLKTYFGGKLPVRIHGYDDVDMICSREKATTLKEWLNK